MGGEVMEFEILFDDDVKHVAQERIWHPTQEVIEQEDGRVLLKFKAGGLQEIKGWLLGFGPRVEVLHPQELRDAIVSDLEAATRRYLG
jgi:proteasome accessory factor B